MKDVLNDLRCAEDSAPLGVNDQLRAAIRRAYQAREQMLDDQLIRTVCGRLAQQGQGLEVSIDDL